MADFAFSFPVGDAVDLALALQNEDGSDFNLAAYLAAGGVATFRLVRETGMVRKVFSTTAVEVASGDASNVATIHILAGQLTVQGAYSATLTTTDDPWEGTVTVGAPGSSPSVTAAGLSTSPSLPDASATVKGTLRLAGDLGGTAAAPEVRVTHLSAPLPEAQGGTGALSLSTATVLAPGASTPRSLAEWMGDVVNARGEGVSPSASAATNVARLNAALEKVQGGGVVFLPPGDYDLGDGTEAIVLNGKGWLVGGGMGRTTLRYTGTGAALTCNGGDGITTHGWRVADLTIDGEAAGATGMRFGQVSVSPLSAGGLVSSVEVKRFQTYGIHLVASQLNAFVDVRSTDHAGDGLFVEAALGGVASGIPNTLTAFYRCRFLRANRGAYIQTYDTFLFDHCEFEDCEAEGMLVERPDDTAVASRLLHVRDCYFEDNNHSSGIYNLRFTSLGTTINQNVKVSGSRFQQGSGKRAISFGRGYYEIADNEPIISAGVLYAEDSATVFIHGRSRFAADSEWVLDAGSRAMIVWETIRDGEWRVWTNVSGTMTKVLETASGKINGTFAAPYEVVDVTGTTLIASTGKTAIRLSASAPTTLWGLGASNETHSVGSVVALTFADSNVRLAPNRSGDTLRFFRLRHPTDSGSSATFAAGDSITLIKEPDHSWRELSRTRTAVPPFGAVARHAPTYGASVAIDTRLGSEFAVTATNGGAFTIANPLHPIAGQRLTIRVRNTSGGALGTITWDTAYKMAAWTSPATGQSRAIDFQYDGTDWIEVSRTPADVPN